MKILQFLQKFKKKPIIDDGLPPLSIPDMPEVEIPAMVKAKQKRERRRIRNLSHLSHRNDDRKTTGAFGRARNVGKV